MIVQTISQFRKKYTLAILLYLAGTTIAIMTKATLGEYTFFAGTVLSIFGTADLIDKDKFRKAP